MRRRFFLISWLCLLTVASSASAATPRIVGGQVASPADWGFVAALETSFGSQFCGGSLVSPQWVLTAGHCRIYSASAIRIITGSVKLDDITGQVLLADTQIRHPLYRQPVMGAPRDDLMLVHLTTASIAAVIPIATGDKAPPAGTLLHVAGWGSTSYTASTDSYGPGTVRLQETPVRVSPAALCTAAYGTEAFETEDMVCAALPARDACAGDSGGPLINGTGSNGVLVGVVSWGTGCGLRRYPGVYSLTVHNRCWIESVIKPPSAPAVLVTGQADGSLSVDWQWSKPCGTAPNPTGFRIRVLETGQQLDVGGDARRAVLPGLTNGAPLTISVSSLNINGESAPLTTVATPTPNPVSAQEAVWSAYHQATSTFQLAPHATDLQWRIEAGTDLRFSPRPWQLAPASVTPITITTQIDGVRQDRALDIRITTTDGATLVSTERVQLSAPVPPSPLSAPRLQGRPTVGSSLRCELGRWSGTRPFVASRQWLRDRQPILGQTAQVYVVGVVDAGSALTCRVRISGPGGIVRRTTPGLEVRG